MSSAREVLVRMLTEKDMLMYLAAAEQQVDAILRALDAAGYAVVPKVATEAMIDAAWTAVMRNDAGGAETWCAMVAAAEKAGGEV